MAENGGNSGVKATGRSPGAGVAAGQAESPGRQERLARALRDNLRKRKAQQRGRRDGPGADRAPAEAPASGAPAEETAAQVEGAPGEGRGRDVAEGEPDGR